MVRLDWLVSPPTWVPPAHIANIVLIYCFPSYCITLLSTSTLWFLLWRENKRRAALNLDKAEAEKLGFEDLTDRQNLHFVYAL